MTLEEPRFSFLDWLARFCVFTLGWLAVWAITTILCSLWWRDVTMWMLGIAGYLVVAPAYVGAEVVLWNYTSVCRDKTWRFTWLSIGGSALLYYPIWRLMIGVFA